MEKVIAIDGPAASGKSSVAKFVSNKLNFEYLDTGAMYRAVTLYVLENNIDVDDEETINNSLKDIHLDFINNKLFMNNRDISTEIRGKDVTAHVSKVCAYEQVRIEMVRQQRIIASKAKNGVVLDGRDIGTVVFKDALLKIYLVASVEARAQRRYKDNVELGINMSLEEIANDLQRRDHLDSTRQFSPLSKAEDAIEIDNSNMNLEETGNAIINLWKEKNA